MIKHEKKKHNESSPYIIINIGTKELPVLKYKYQTRKK